MLPSSAHARRPKDDVSACAQLNALFSRSRKNVCLPEKRTAQNAGTGVPWPPRPFSSNSTVRTQRNEPNRPTPLVVCCAAPLSCKACQAKVLSPDHDDASAPCQHGKSSEDHTHVQEQCPVPIWQLISQSTPSGHQARRDGTCCTHTALAARRMRASGGSCATATHTDEGWLWATPSQGDGQRNSHNRRQKRGEEGWIQVKGRTDHPRLLQRIALNEQPARFAPKKARQRPRGGGGPRATKRQRGSRGLRRGGEG